MIEIFSATDPTKLLHLVVRMTDFTEERHNILEPSQFIQCAALRLHSGKTFKAHQHLWKIGPERVIAQESWVVIKGRVRCQFFDTSGTPLTEIDLEAGDASFTLAGGHNYIALDEGTFVYEYKTGPYDGQTNDKVFL